jgi:2-amino-4-hydroxy-6-hydroxymethyldihydropteridine diphosphokinase
MAGAPWREPVTAYVGIGANLGDAATAVSEAIERLAGLPESALASRSSLYRSAPVDAAGPDYVNAVVALRTSLTAPRLLDELQRIEQGAGRTRPYRNAPRTLDLDLLLFGAAAIASERLTIPHPRLFQRAFVLLPLAEIASERVSAEALLAVASQVVNRIA